MKNTGTLLFCFLVFVNCIDRIEIELDRDPNIIPVIDGWVTDKEGPHYIKLRYSKRFSDFFYDPLTNAKITLTDDLGNKEVFVEFDSGRYATTPTFKVIEGRTYRLEVGVGEDKYISSDMSIKKGVPMESFTYRIDSSELLSKNGEIYYTDGISLTTKLTNPEQTLNYYSYRVQSTYLFEALLVGDSSEAKWCYVTDDYRKISIVKDKTGDYEHPFAFYEFSLDFLHSISFLAKQYSMTREAYDYWEKVVAQSKNSGSLFDRPIYTIKGNMSHHSDDKKIMLGLFTLYSESEQRIILHNKFSSRQDVNLSYCTGEYPPPKCTDCMTIANNGSSEVTNIRPEWWQ